MNLGANGDLVSQRTGDEEKHDAYLPGGDTRVPQGP
jgi:hypothetical protein